jgi:hypothetical protein
MMLEPRFSAIHRNNLQGEHLDDRSIDIFFPLILLYSNIGAGAAQAGHRVL